MRSFHATRGTNHCPARGGAATGGTVAMGLSKIFSKPESNRPMNNQMAAAGFQTGRTAAAEAVDSRSVRTYVR
jgi:hypothetical protein